MNDEREPTPEPSANLPPPRPPRGPTTAAAFGDDDDDDENSKHRVHYESIRLLLIPQSTNTASASTAEQIVLSELPPGAALSLPQRRILWSVFFFILLSVPLLSGFTYIRLGEFLGETLAWFSFFSSIVAAGFACGLIAAKLNSRTRFGFITSALLSGLVYTALEFFLFLACWGIVNPR